MWVTIGSEVLNLDHIVRIRFHRTFKNGKDDLCAEVDALVKGEVQTFVRYRGAEAEHLQAMVQAKVRHGSYEGPGKEAMEQGLGQSMAGTIADMKIA
jgi:hypothetical protein